MYSVQCPYAVQFSFDYLKWFKLMCVEHLSSRFQNWIVSHTETECIAMQRGEEEEVEDWIISLLICFNAFVLRSDRIENLCLWPLCDRVSPVYFFQFQLPRLHSIPIRHLNILTSAVTFSMTNERMNRSCQSAIIHIPSAVAVVISSRCSDATILQSWAVWNTTYDWVVWVSICGCWQYSHLLDLFI